jgi:hypothetical protein
MSWDEPPFRKSRFSILYVENFSGGLAFPIASLLQGPIKFNGSSCGTFIDTGAAIPAFVGMQDYGRLTFLGIGYVDVYRTDLNTAVAPVADISLENYRPAGCRDIGEGEDLFLNHVFLLDWRLVRRLNVQRSLGSTS